MYTYISDEEFINIGRSENRCSVDLPMFYINLDKRIPRRELMEKEKRKHNLNITRFSAIDGMATTTQNLVTLHELARGSDTNRGH